MPIFAFMRRSKSPEGTFLSDIFESLPPVQQLVAIASSHEQDAGFDVTLEADGTIWVENGEGDYWELLKKHPTKLVATAP